MLRPCGCEMENPSLFIRDVEVDRNIALPRIRFGSVEPKLHRTASTCTGGARNFDFRHRFNERTFATLLITNNGKFWKREKAYQNVLEALEKEEKNAQSKRRGMWEYGHVGDSDED